MKGFKTLRHEYLHYCCYLFVFGPAPESLIACLWQLLFKPVQGLNVCEIIHSAVYKFVVIGGRYLKERALFRVLFQKRKRVTEHYLRDCPELVVGDGLVVGGVLVHPEL